MSSLGDMWDDMWNEAGDSGSSGDHGFALMEFIFGLMKIVGIVIGILFLLGVVICVLEYFNIPATEWLIKLLFG